MCGADTVQQAGVEGNASGIGVLTVCLGDGAGIRLLENFATLLRREGRSFLREKLIRPYPWDGLHSVRNIPFTLPFCVYPFALSPIELNEQNGTSLRLEIYSHGS